MSLIVIAVGFTGTGISIFFIRRCGRHCQGPTLHCYHPFLAYHLKLWRQRRHFPERSIVLNRHLHGLVGPRV